MSNVIAYSSNDVARVRRTAYVLPANPNHHSEAADAGDATTLDHCSLISDRLRRVDEHHGD
jgi:hypothetical protein